MVDTPQRDQTCVGMSVQEVTRCSKSKQTFQKKGPWEEGGPWGRWSNLAANTILLLFLFAAQEWRPCPTTPRCTTTTPIFLKTRAVTLKRSTTTKLLSSKFSWEPSGARAMWCSLPLAQCSPARHRVGWSFLTPSSQGSLAFWRLRKFPGSVFVCH